MRHCFKIGVMSEITVRRAAAEDAPTVINLLTALAEYEKLMPPDAAGQERLTTEMASAKPRFEAYLVENDRKAIGYAIVFETYGTFMAQPKLYLEDLFILPEYRGMGAGKALFQTMIEEARIRGCAKLEWTALDWNTPAHDFYHKMGGRRINDLQVFQLKL
jgi:GNAT superfamily N-acetyltransferase